MIEEKIYKSVLRILNLAHDKKENLVFKLLKGDASERDYYRISFKSSDKKTYVLMKMKKGFNSCAEEITKSEKKIDELPFLNVHKYLELIESKVPEIIGFDEGSAVIVLEDLGDESLYSLFPRLSKNEITDIYKRLIEELVSMQTATPPDFPCVAFHRRYDEEMCMWELEHFTEWGIEALLKTKLGKKEKRAFDDFYKKIAAEFMSAKFQFCHRDYHSKNVMMSGNSFKIIDFQDALLAPQQYDLASLLRDSYITLEEEDVTKLINHYLELFKDKSGLKAGKPSFEKSFDWISVHRNLKAAGRFVFIDKKKNDDSYLKHIPSTLNNVKRNLKKYDEFKVEREVFLEYIEKIKMKLSSLNEGNQT